jgi:hypothetical protein
MPELVALRPTKISASDPPSVWWPGERSRLAAEGAAMNRSIQQAAVWVVAVTIGIALVEWRYGNPSLKDVLGWAGVLVSTFVGAAMAFLFNAVRVSKDREEKEYIAANLALITLVEFLDRLLQYKQVYIQPVKDRRDVWFFMRAGQLINFELKIDKASLAFLLTKYAMTWRAIVLEEMRFNGLKDAIDHRNKLVNEEVWPKMDKRAIGQGTFLTTTEAAAIFGPATTQELKNATAYILENCEQNIQSLTTCIADLRKVLMEKFPGREFL